MLCLDEIKQRRSSSSSQILLSSQGFLFHSPPPFSLSLPLLFLRRSHAWFRTIVGDYSMACQDRQGDVFRFLQRERSQVLAVKPRCSPQRSHSPLRQRRYVTKLPIARFYRIRLISYSKTVELTRLLYSLFSKLCDLIDLRVCRLEDSS